MTETPKERSGGRPEPPPEDDQALLQECREEFLRGSGPGGQHRNRRETAVRLTHLPTGISVVAQDERSQHRNREIALERLRAKLEERARQEKERRETKVPKREKRRRLEAKRRRSRIKKLRRPPSLDE